LHFKGHEFVTFKVRVIQFFPDSNKFKGVSVAHPALNQRIITKIYRKIYRLKQIYH